jgi:outer membrane protein OmpA-like peptidoglycan-associated protein
MVARRISLAALPCLLALVAGCGGTAVPEPATEATPSATSDETKAAGTDEAPAAGKPAEEPAATSEASPAKPAAEPAPQAAQGPAPDCEPKGGKAAAKGPKLELTVDRSKVDLEGHQIEVKLSRPACKVVLKVIGESGKELASVTQGFDGMPAGTALMVGWRPQSAETVARIEVWGHDTQGYYVGVAITPWNVKIPHEEVNFETDSDAIRTSEVPKLEASLDKIKEAITKHKDLGGIALYIAGHTDTVGGADHNLSLSRRRARSIAAWFRSHGLKMPISYEGLGEHSPLVKTADETAEARNRRVDYILSLDPPRLPSGTVNFGWKGL